MIDTLTDEQYNIFMGKLSGALIRDQCIMLFMLHGGLRNGEVCKLLWRDVCIGKEIFHTINIINGHSRIKNTRYVTLSPKLVETIGKYQAWYDSSYSFREPPLSMFITRNRKVRISQRDIQRLVNIYTKAWLQQKFTPHSLRHTFATRLMRCSNIRVVQQLLGHSSLLSTQVYTHPNSEDRNNAINKAF